MHRDALSTHTLEPTPPKERRGTAKKDSGRAQRRAEVEK
eukprot:IDg19877t1